MSETNEGLERLERFLAKFRAAGERYALAAAEYERLDHERRMVRAAIMKEAEANGITAIAAQEREAMASREYAEAVGKLYAARLEEGLAKSGMEALRLAASLSQTLKANERAEIRAYT